MIVKTGYLSLTPVLFLSPATDRDEPHGLTPRLVPHISTHLVPFLFGMPRSRRTTSGLNRSAVATPASPSYAVSTSWPSIFNNVARLSALFINDQNAVFFAARRSAFFARGDSVRN